MAHSPTVTIRRARRTDFERVATLAGIDAGAAERRALRHFRRVVADLGTDFYVAVVEQAVVGFVYVSYVRQPFAPPRARIEELRIGAALRPEEVRQALLNFACERAGQRGCEGPPAAGRPD